MRAFACTACLVILLACGACRTMGQADHEGRSPGTPERQPQDARAITGTVRYIDLEGGFYGIETDDGASLDPVNLPQEYRKDGLRVKVRVERLEDQVSFRMWGTLVRVLEIERL